MSRVKRRAAFTIKTDQAIRDAETAVRAILRDGGTTGGEKSVILRRLFAYVVDQGRLAGVFDPQGDYSADAIARRIMSGEDLGTKFEETKI